MATKVSLAAIRLRAGYIASATGRPRTTVTQDLINAHNAIKVEIDYGDRPRSNDLNFVGGGFHPEETQELPVKEIA